MDKIKCPYCECTVKMIEVDAEGGTCPECGAVITGSHLFDDDLAGDDLDELDDEAIDDLDDDDDSDY